MTDIEGRPNTVMVRLRQQLREAQARSLEQAWGTMEREHWREAPDFGRRPLDDGWKGRLAHTAEELDSTLPEIDIDDEVAREFATGGWSLGTEIEVLAPRTILRGYLVPVRELPTGVPVTLKVFAFLTIDGERDWLVRENHGFGMHYHYVLADKRRTTTMICWDTRWISSDPQEPKGLQDRPIFHQLHAEGSNVAVAHPQTWGDKKRQSVREACKPDLRKQNVGDFLCAADRANAVWPKGVQVTPRIRQPVVVAPPRHHGSHRRTRAR